MNEKELYQQKIQAQLDEWEAEGGRIKAKLSGLTADAQLELNKQIEKLESKLEEGKTKLAENQHASEEAWAAIKEELDSALDSMKSSLDDAAAKFKK